MFYCDFSDRKNKPSPPKASTRMTINSNALMLRNPNWIEEITPKIKAITEPSVSIVGWAQLYRAHA